LGTVREEEHTSVPPGEIGGEGKRNRRVGAVIVRVAVQDVTVDGFSNKPKFSTPTFARKTRQRKREDRRQSRP